VKILLVEQNPTLRGLLRSILELGKADIAEASDAASALRAFSDYHPDWVLMDMSLREMDGLDATRLITKAHPEARVMIVADQDSLALRKKAREAGAGGIIVKENLYNDLRRTDFLPTAFRRPSGR
jgi:DNA-binding NarL/FixJ family response regulator